MGMIVAANNTKLAIAGVNIGKLKTLGFSHARETKEVTTIDSDSHTGGWKEYVAGIKGGTSITGTLLYTPDAASHLYANGGLLGDLACWNLLTNGDFAGAVGATTCYGWTETGDVDVHVISQAQSHNGGTSFYWEEASGGATQGFQQQVTLEGGETYYASLWYYCIATAGAPNGANWSLTGSETGLFHTDFFSGTSQWTRVTKSFTADEAGEPLTFFFGGNTKNGTNHGTFVDGAMLVKSSVLTDFHASDQEMQTFTITLPEADGGSCTVSGMARLTKFDTKAQTGEILEADFELITSGTVTFSYNVT